MVLHTWGSKLNRHYHVHCIITGGGLNGQKDQWIPSKSARYLFPVAALSTVFRAKYLAGMDRLRSKLVIPSCLSDTDWDTYKHGLVEKDWVVYAKPPFGGPDQVIKYLGRYANRIAISSRRILSYQNGEVTFRYKDYQRGNRIRNLTISDEAFATRFLQHVLPKGFCRIRYYGFLANCHRKKNLAICRKLLDCEPVSADHTARPDEATEPDTPSLCEPETRKCPSCQQNTLTLARALYEEERRLSRALLWDSS